MANSGSKSVTVTNWDTLKFTWWISSQSIANNRSVVGWDLELIAGSSGRIDSSVSKDWKVVVNGVTYSGTNTIGISNNATKTLASGTTTISHNADGSKTFSYSFSQEFAITFSGSTIGTKTGSGTGTLNTINRLSELSVASGTLGTALTLSVTRHSTDFTHGITYKCGTAGGTVCASSTTSTSISFTPPMSLASQNTSGTTVSITFAITTYRKGTTTSIGSKSVTKTFTIPSSVKPTCSLTVEDATSYYGTFGVYLKGYSKFKVTVTPKTSYGSAIASYSTRANGSTYTSASFTTGVLKTSGTLEVNATVKDKRGRSGTASVSATVVNYQPPQINTLKVKRCKEDGTEDISGAFGLVTFGGAITDVNGKNTATFTLEYKKSSEDTFTAIVLDAETIATGQYIFPAEDASSYNIRLTVADLIEETTATTILSTAGVLMHWGASGQSMGIGKIAELEKVLDIGFQTRFHGGILHPILEHGTDLNDVITPNTYVGMSVTEYGYGNLPSTITSGTFTLEVVGAGEVGQIKQKFTYCNKTQSRVYERFRYQNTWGEWFATSDFNGQLLWQGAWYMNASHTATLAEPISKQPNGIVLVFSRYAGGESKNYEFSFHFVPKMQVALQQGQSFIAQMTDVDGSYFTAKQLSLYDDKIVGDDRNNQTFTGANGITYTNAATVLRYVIGV